MINKLKIKLKNFYLIVKGRSLSLKRSIKIQHKWFGNQYGGFYLHTENLNEDSIIYSFGIGEDISFDLQLIEEFKSKVYGFDPTPKSIKWVNSQEFPSQFIFSDYGIGKETGNVTFYLPKNKEHVSGSVHTLPSLDSLEPVSVPMKKFADIAKSIGHHTIDVLKMDIEGAEYDIIPEILNSGVMIKQILIEYHHRMFDGGGDLTKKSIQMLKNNGFELFAYSATFEELSFINTKNLDIY